VYSRKSLRLTFAAPYKESSHCCSHIQERAYLVESLDVKALVGRGNPVRSVQGGEQTGRP
jgi:hypothetical protein